MNKKVSLKDIAKEVGVSTALVSYVLNNLKEGRIRKEVAQKIREVAQRLNYSPNHIAKSLKTRKTYTIGLIVADISNPFSSTLARIIEDEAHKMLYTVIFGSSDENADKFSRLVETFLNKQVDGLIISPPAGSENSIEALIRQDIPFVLLDRYFPTLQTNYVLLDNLAAAEAATAYLLENGYGQPALITYSSELVHLSEREKGYLAALKKHGAEPDTSLIRKVDIINNRQEIARSLNDLLNRDDRPRSIMFGSNIIASQCLQLINRLPITVPDDIAIVCFDETESLHLFKGPLTFVRQPLREMGQSATRILIEQFGPVKSITQVKLKAELVVAGRP